MKLAALADAAGLAAASQLGDWGQRTVTGFAIDHRKVAPGTVFGAFQGARVQWRGFHPCGGRRRRDRGGRAARGQGRGRGAYRRRRAAPGVCAARRALLPAVSRNRRRRHRHQRQDLDGRDDAPALAHGGRSRGLDRHAGRHHPRRIRFDRADHARHRHLPLQHGRACARRRHPCRLRGVEPRPGAISHRGAAGRRRRLHQSQPRPSRLSRDMEDYFEAKMRLFDEVVADGGTAVVWLDDEWAERACRACQDKGSGRAHRRRAGEGDPSARPRARTARPGAGTRL